MHTHAHLVYLSLALSLSRSLALSLLQGHVQSAQHGGLGGTAKHLIKRHRILGLQC